MREPQAMTFHAQGSRTASDGRYAENRLTRLTGRLLPARIPSETDHCTGSSEPVRIETWAVAQPWWHGLLHRLFGAGED